MSVSHSVTVPSVYNSNLPIPSEICCSPVEYCSRVFFSLHEQPTTLGDISVWALLWHLHLQKGGWAI